jgi:hypothetical protein
VAPLLPHFKNFKRFLNMNFITCTLRHLWADCLDNVGSLISHNPIGLHSLLRG